MHIKAKEASIDEIPGYQWETGNSSLVTALLFGDTSRPDRRHDASVGSTLCDKCCLYVFSWFVLNFFRQRHFGHITRVEGIQECCCSGVGNLANSGD